MKTETRDAAIHADLCLTALDAIVNAPYGGVALAFVNELTKKAVDNLTLLFEHLHADPSEANIDNIFADEVVMSHHPGLPGYRPNPPWGGFLIKTANHPDITADDRRHYIKNFMIPSAVHRIIFDMIRDDEKIYGIHPLTEFRDIFLRDQMIRQWRQADLSSEFRNSVRALQRAVYEYAHVPVPPCLLPVSPP